MLEKLWEVGGFSEAPEEFFGVIVALDTDSRGNVYLLDKQLSDVRVFDADGRYVRTLGGEGEGPGEFRQPGSLCVLPDDQLCVLQTNPTRRSLFTPDGIYAGELARPAPLDTLQQFYGLHVEGDVIAAQGLSTTVGEDAMESRGGLYRYAQGDSVAVQIAPTYRRFDFAAKVIREMDGLTSTQWCLGQDGRLYWVDGGDYTIRVWDPAGRPELTIARAFEHLRRSKEDKARVEDGYRRGGGTESVTIEVEDFARDVAWMVGAPGGGLWVSSSRSNLDLPEGAMARVDVYGKDGVLTEELTLRGEGRFGADRLYVEGDRLYVLRHAADAFRAWQATLAWNRGADGDETSSDEEPEPMSVICYRLPGVRSRR
ncbi:MAG: 6-bladed beta-propeller [Candidatus Krumholzibacteriia bacterium]